MDLRKLVTYTEDVAIEGGRPCPKPLRLFAAAAVLRNPWAGGGGLRGGSAAGHP